MSQPPDHPPASDDGADAPYVVAGGCLVLPFRRPPGWQLSPRGPRKYLTLVVPINAAVAKLFFRHLQVAEADLPCWLAATGDPPALERRYWPGMPD